MCAMTHPYTCHDSYVFRDSEDKMTVLPTVTTPIAEDIPGLDSAVVLTLNLTPVPHVPCTETLKQIGLSLPLSLSLFSPLSPSLFSLFLSLYLSLSHKNSLSFSISFPIFISIFLSFFLSL